MINLKIINNNPSTLKDALKLAELVFEPTHEEREKYFRSEDWERKFKNSGLLSVAYIDDEPVGFAICYKKEVDYLHIWNVGVLPDHRRKGVWKEVYNSIIEYAKSNDFHKVSLNTFKDKWPSMYAFVLANGFDEIKTLDYDDPKLGVIKKSYFEKTL